MVFTTKKYVFSIIAIIASISLIPSASALRSISDLTGTEKSELACALGRFPLIAATQAIDKQNKPLAHKILSLSANTTRLIGDVLGSANRFKFYVEDNIYSFVLHGIDAVAVLRDLINFFSNDTISSPAPTQLTSEERIVVQQHFDFIANAFNIVILPAIESAAASAKVLAENQEPNNITSQLQLTMVQALARSLGALIAAKRYSSQFNIQDVVFICVFIKALGDWNSKIIPQLRAEAQRAAAAR